MKIELHIERVYRRVSHYKLNERISYSIHNYIAHVGMDMNPPISLSKHIKLCVTARILHRYCTIDYDAQSL